MRPFTVFLLSLCLAALGPAAAPAHAQEDGGLAPGGVRVSQLRDASDEALVRLFFGSVRAFPYAAYRDRSRFTGRMRRASVQFYSQARATDRAGVCRTDRMTIALEHGFATGEDPLLRPAGFALQPIFIVENREEARRLFNPTRRSDYERDAACIALDPRRDGVPADSAFQLMQAQELTGALAAAAREGRALVPIDCSGLNPNSDPPVGADEASCLREIAALGDSDDEVRWVRTCLNYRDAPGGCILVMTSRWWVEFDKNVNQSPRRARIEAFEDLSQVNWSSG